MHIHRSVQDHDFTVLPNALLQDRRLSFTARGLLVDLLSRPDGWREDGRQMADSSPQGRMAVARSLRELTAAGYYLVVKVRLPGGGLTSEAHVWDTPQQVAPDITRMGPGESVGGGRVAPTPKETGERNPLPPPPQAAAAAAELDQGGGAAAVDLGDPAVLADPAVAVLLQVIRPEPRLRVGLAEALKLAPLVRAWLDRGCTQLDLSQALLPGLPAFIRSPLGLLRDRLTRKLPPPPGWGAPEPRPAGAGSAPSPAPSPAPAPAGNVQVVRVATAALECELCRDPVLAPGICKPCAGLGRPAVAVGLGEAATARGAALVRTALGVPCGAWPTSAESGPVRGTSDRGSPGSRSAGQRRFSNATGGGTRAQRIGDPSSVVVRGTAGACATDRLWLGTLVTSVNPRSPITG